MVPAFNPMSCPNLAVPAEVMQHLVRVESGANPFAIGVVGGRLERQPRNLGEAVATARMLESNGYDYSLGIAQINRGNLAYYGLDTFPKAFDGCANLAAGARILAGCYRRSGGNWGKAFSCYYSGNFTTGYRDGYVQRVYASIDADSTGSADPIWVHPQNRVGPDIPRANALSRVKPGTSAYRVSMRSLAIDPAANALVSAIAQAATGPRDAKAISRPQIARTAAPGTPDAPDNPVFVPRVSGPEGAPVTTASAFEPQAHGHFSPPAAGQAGDPDLDPSDAAFVF